MKKFALCALFIVLTIVLLNLISWFYLGLQLSNLASSDISQIESNNQKVETWVRGYPFVSLGAYRLPYLHHSYQLISTSSQLAAQLTPSLNQMQQISQASLNSESMPEETITSLLSSISTTPAQLELLLLQLQQPEIRYLASIFQIEPERIRLIHQLDSAKYILSTINQHHQTVIDLLGYQQPRHIVVLLQNNMELWPTGGYLGSYASFWLDQGAIKDLKVEAIDVPNGQIKGYVKSPDPITTYVHKGGDPGWTLRASNWDPDFPQGFEAIDWFFSEGGVEPIDTLIGINLIPIIDFIDAIGGIELPDYQTTISSENFYATTQKNTSYNFFDGSTQKTDFLGYLSRQILYQITNNPKQYLLPLAATLSNNLATNQIILASNNQASQTLFNQLNWDGSIDPTGCIDESTNCLPDYLHLNEANLGINKTNCCLERDFDHSINIDANNQMITHQLSLLYINHNPPTPEPPDEWGGGYRAYLRLYVPQSSQLKSIIENEQNPITSDQIDIYQQKDKQIFAFPILVPGKQAREYTITYQAQYDLNNQTEYQLQIHKQSGIESIPWQIHISDGTNTTSSKLDLDRDTWIDFPLSP